MIKIGDTVKGKKTGRIGKVEDIKLIGNRSFEVRLLKIFFQKESDGKDLKWEDWIHEDCFEKISSSFAPRPGEVEPNE